MSASTILFTNKMVGRNINVEKNDKGWYRVKIGEVNAFNNKGEYYLDTGLRELLTEKNSYLSVANRLESGLLEGEVTHPIREGHSDSDWLSRNLIIDGARATHKFMQIDYIVTNRKELGNNVVELWAWILPTENDLGRALKADLDNPDVNVAFSIRCFSKLVTYNGHPARVITKIICWDKIDIPGIKNAVKGGSVEAITKEAGLKDYLVDIGTLDNLVVKLSNKALMTTENAGMLDTIKSLRNDLVPCDNLFFKW